MEKEMAIKELSEHDHAVLTADFAQELAEPFGLTLNGIVGDSRRMIESGKPGGVVNSDGPGVSAHVLAERIAKLYGFEPYQNGIGSRLRTACAYVLEHLA